MKKNIVLIGMPGVGKSTIGVIIAKILGYQFIDADLVIQEQYGKLLKEIIAERGTEGFVQVENDVNKSLNPEKAVISTHWLKENNPKPYGSYGNGSAMRVSAAGWLYDSIERTREVARATANVTHNHPEGIKGAEATASAIYMARNGSSKEEIKEYIEREFHYDLSRTLDNIRPYYHHVESCQETVPETIIAFLESKDFEDAVRNAVSLGGDTDTLGAITGSIAEAFYGIPAVLIAECKSRIDKGLMTDVLDEFDHVLGSRSVF